MLALANHLFLTKLGFLDLEKATERRTQQPVRFADKKNGGAVLAVQA